MSLFIEYGIVHIPKEKRDAFTQDAKEIAHYDGLISLKEVTLYGKTNKLLSFPSFTEQYANFFCNYFENIRNTNVPVDELLVLKTETLSDERVLEILKWCTDKMIQSHDLRISYWEALGVVIME